MAELKIKRRVLSACQTNCYYVYREGADEVIVIDPGDRGDVVYEDVKQLGFEKVAGILLTHGHGDHTGGAIELKSRSGAKIYAFEEFSTVMYLPEYDTLPSEITLTAALKLIPCNSFSSG